MKFSVVVPVYNVEKYINGCLKSILDQTFDDYQVIVVDDHSTDTSKIKAAQWAGRDNRIHIIPERPTKMYNGGARNHIIEYVKEHFDPQYYLFLDSDDKFTDRYALSRIYACAERYEAPNYPELIRLSYRKRFAETGRETTITLDEATIEDVTWSKRVAAWTKAVRSDKIVLFPENTLFEDVVQHIKQCDVVNDFRIIKEPIVEWNIRGDSTSRNNSPKWQSSAWRFVADLMDLELTKPYTNHRRNKKIKGAKNSLADGLFIQ